MARREEGEDGLGVRYGGPPAWDERQRQASIVGMARKGVHLCGLRGVPDSKGHDLPLLRGSWGEEEQEGTLTDRRPQRHGLIGL